VCVRGDVRYFEGRTVIDIEFNYPNLDPLPSDWVGIYPCEDADLSPPFRREPPLWAFTCYDRNCRSDPDDSATGIGNFTFDDMTKPSFTSGGIYKTIEKIITESPGCYKIMLNRIDGDNAPPYYEICQGNEINLLPALLPTEGPSVSSLPSSEPSSIPSGSSLPSSEPSLSPSGSSIPSSEPSSSPSNVCVRGDVRYFEGRTVIDIEFNYPNLDPLPSDWVGIYPCEDANFSPPFRREPPLWAYTCYDRNCRIDPDDSATGVGNFTFDDITKPIYTTAQIYTTIEQMITESPGCYIIMLNRINGDNAPPYYEICQGNEIDLLPPPTSSPLPSSSPSGSSVPSSEPSSSPSTPRSFITIGRESPIPLSPHLSPEPTVKHVDPVEACQKFSFSSSQGTLLREELDHFEEETLEFLTSHLDQATSISSVTTMDQTVQLQNRFLRALQGRGTEQVVNMKLFIEGFVTPDDDGYSFGNTVDLLFISNKTLLQDALELKGIFITFNSSTKLNLRECQN